jgi:hypothetical protein
MLKGQGRSDGGIASVGVALASRLVILQEDFADLAISEAADSAGVLEARDLNLESLGKPPIGKAVAMRCRFA